MKQGAQHVRGRIVQTPAHEDAGWSAVTVDLADGAVCGDFDPSLETVTDAEAGVVETDANAQQYGGAHGSPARCGEGAREAAAAGGDMCG